jgi:hypothetical protein
MSTLFSGHVVTSKDENWGKVLVITGFNHKKDREDPIVSKHEPYLLAWETIKEFDVRSGVRFTHDCGQNLSKEDKDSLKIIVDAWVLENLPTTLDDFNLYVRQMRVKQIRAMGVSWNK